MLMTTHRVFLHALAACGAACFAALGPAPLSAQEPAAPQQITLDEAIALALKQGYQARADLDTRDAARYTNDAFDAGLLPQLSVSGTLPQYNRAIVPVVQPDGTTLFRAQDQTTTGLSAMLSQTLPVTGGRLYVQSSLSRLSVSGPQGVLTWSSTPVTIGISQPILQANASAWDHREQRATAESAEREYRRAREDVALQTAGTFFDVYAAQATLETATRNAAINDTLYTLNQGRFNIGKIDENQLLQSQLALLRSRTQVDAAKLQLQRALAALRLGLNLPEDAAIAVVPPQDIPAFDPDTARAVSEALANAPAVSQARLQQVQAERQLTEARLSNWLGATLNASYGFNATGSDIHTAYQDLLEAQRVQVSVDLPLLQWGAHHAGVKAAEAGRDRAERLAEETLRQTALDARFAALGFSQARRNLILSAAGDTVGQKRFDVAYKRYLIGKTQIEDLYIAQNEKDQARTQYVQALRGVWQAYYTLRSTTLYDFVTGEELR
jgi:outer membrane protein TolC